ncbi:MAG: hydroxymethylbilane synthase [Lacipirellulaceae bacterium]
MKRYEAPLRLGTRASPLARWQADWVAAALRAEGQAVETVEVKTQGDVQQVGPIAAIGAQGVFTKELQRRLLDGDIDLAVHSLKDLPTAAVPGLVLAATPPRAALGDALVSRVADSLDALPHGARVGTGSSRRRAQLLNRRPDLMVGDLRGNVDTRLRKLDDGEHDAILLAQAGLVRLGLADRITQAIPPDVLLPAPGQGALGIECRVADARTVAALFALDDSPTRAAVTAERAALARLEGGCLASLGAWGRIEGGELRLSVCVLSEEGDRRLDAELAVRFTQGFTDGAALGVRVADELRARGAVELLRPRS